MDMNATFANYFKGFLLILNPSVEPQWTTELGLSTLIFVKFLLLKKLTLLRTGIQINVSNKQISTKLLKCYIYILITIKMKTPIILIITDVYYHLSIKQYLSSMIYVPCSAWNQTDAKINALSLQNV